MSIFKDRVKSKDQEKAAEERQQNVAVIAEPVGKLGQYAGSSGSQRHKEINAS
jgi:hypothetical protein